MRGTIRRIQFNSANQPPRPLVATATPNRRSSQADGQLQRLRLGRPSGASLSYAWDLDGDGAYPMTLPRHLPYVHHSSAGAYNVDLRVTDPQGLSDTLDPKRS